MNAHKMIVAVWAGWCFIASFVAFAYGAKSTAVTFLCTGMVLASQI